MPFALHLRKSRADIEAELRGEGESLSRHKKRLVDFAERMQMDIVAEYREIISGDKLSDRPEMQRLLSDVAAGMYEGVLTVEVSRLTRGDLMDQGRIMNTFKYSGTKIITPEHTYDLSEDWDEDVITSDMMMARREYKYIKRRLQRGRLASANEGLWQSPAPFGYRKVKIPRGKGWTLEPDPEQAPLVKMIFEAYAVERIGGAKIAQRLNDLGSRTTRGNLWTADTVAWLSRNPVYTGKVRWNDRVSVTRMDRDGLQVRREKSATPILADGKHPPIISQELFEAVQRVRAGHDLTRNHTSAPVRNPLSGLVFCAECGRAMVRKDNGNARGARYDMLKCPRAGCPTTATALSIVEDAVIDALTHWSVSVDISEDRIPDENPREKALDAARTNLNRLRAQRERIFAAYEEGAYNTADFVRRRNEKDREIESAESALRELEETVVPSREEILRYQLPQIRSVLDVYRLTPDPIDRNRLLKTVIERIHYKKTARCYRGQNPAQALELTFFPRIPKDLI